MPTDFPCTHLTLGARGSLRLVHDDADRRDLLERVGAALGALVLAYCVVDTHLHVVAEVAPEHGVRWLDGAIAGYIRAFHRRHAAAGALILRGPVETHVAPSREEAARQVRYVHANPLKTAPPLAARAIDYPWSSARAWAGLSLAGPANVARGRALLGPDAPRIERACVSDRPPGALPAAGPPAGPLVLAGGGPRAVPESAPATLLRAAAEAFGLPPTDLVADGRDERSGAARALFLELGRLEGYPMEALAACLGRSRRQAYRIAVPPGQVAHAVRVARTLIREGLAGPCVDGTFPCHPAPLRSRSGVRWHRSVPSATCAGS